MSNQNEPKLSNTLPIINSAFDLFRFPKKTAARRRSNTVNATLTPVERKSQEAILREIIGDPEVEIIRRGPVIKKHLRTCTNPSPSIDTSPTIIRDSPVIEFPAYPSHDSRKSTTIANALSTPHKRTKSMKIGAILTSKVSKQKQDQPVPLHVQSPSVDYYPTYRRPSVDQLLHSTKGKISRIRHRTFSWGRKSVQLRQFDRDRLTEAESEQVEPVPPLPTFDISQYAIDGGKKDNAVNVQPSPIPVSPSSCYSQDEFVVVPVNNTNSSSMVTNTNSDETAKDISAHNDTYVSCPPVETPNTPFPPSAFSRFLKSDPAGGNGAPPIRSMVTLSGSREITWDMTNYSAPQTPRDLSPSPFQQRPTIRRGSSLDGFVGHKKESIMDILDSKLENAMRKRPETSHGNYYKRPSFRPIPHLRSYDGQLRSAYGTLDVHQPRIFYARGSMTLEGCPFPGSSNGDGHGPLFVEEKQRLVPSMLMDNSQSLYRVKSETILRDRDFEFTGIVTVAAAATSLSSSSNPTLGSSTYNSNSWNSKSNSSRSSTSMSMVKMDDEPGQVIQWFKTGMEEVELQPAISPTTQLPSHPLPVKWVETTIERNALPMKRKGGLLAKMKSAGLLKRS